VDPKAEYKVGGPTLKDSSTFRMPQGQGSVALVSNAVSSGGSGLALSGWITAASGLPFLVVGIAALAGAFDSPRVSGYPSAGGSVGDVLGIQFTAMGGIAALTGLILLAIPTPSTTVTTSGGTSVARRTPSKGPKLTPQGLVF